MTVRRQLIRINNTIQSLTFECGCTINKSIFCIKNPSTKDFWRIYIQLPNLPRPFPHKHFSKCFVSAFYKKNIDLKILSSIQCGHYIGLFSDLLPQYQPGQLTGTLHPTKKKTHMRVTSDLLLLWQTLIHEINFKKQIAMYKICGLLSMNEDINFEKITYPRIYPWMKPGRSNVGRRRPGHENRYYRRSTHDMFMVPSYSADQVIYITNWHSSS